ncbi:MAG TPA: DUF4389 domain-containing protein [Acidimicrobiales bacterium]|nr:DUF4389 domain-containing protein [Acidimicrobiales bacterium]
MAPYPVTFDLERPEKMDRAHVFLRILLLVVLSWVAGSATGGGLVYLGLPVVAAILISQGGGERYLTEDGERMTKVLSFLVGLYAYFALLTDQLPGFERGAIRFDVVRSGSPTVSSALWRIAKAIPSAIVLALIGFVSWIVWLVAAIFILASERYPAGLWNFQRGVVRWEARLLAYLASLVDPYPPFSFDTGPASTIP